MMLKKKPFNSHVANVKDSAVELCGEDDAETPLANLVRIGFKAASEGVKSAVAGAFAAARNWGAVAIGFGASAGKAGVAVGHSDDNGEGEPLRDTAYAGDYAVAIGTARAEGARSVSIGQDSKVTPDYAIAIGAGKTDKSNRCAAQADIAIGQEAHTTGTSPGHVAIGYQAAASDAKMTVIGSCSDPAKIYFGDKSLAEIIAAV